MPDKNPTVAAKILRRLNILTAATVGLALVLVSIVVYFAIQQSHNTQALCAFKNDIIKRQADAASFLAAHPKGAYGFSYLQIKQQIDNYQRTEEALSSVHCSPPV